MKVFIDFDFFVLVKDLYIGNILNKGIGELKIYLLNLQIDINIIIYCIDMLIYNILEIMCVYLNYECINYLLKNIVLE